MHIPAILAASLSAFLVGGLWYSPLLFGAAWRRASGVTEAVLNAQNRGRTFSLAFVVMGAIIGGWR